MDITLPISLIVAVADNNVIGFENALPWHLPEDLKHFKALTTGKPIIMGRKTCESLRGPLPNRLNIVVSRNPLSSTGFQHAYSIPEALNQAQAFYEKENAATTKEIMIIGGAQLYKASLPYVKKMYVTQVHIEPRGDTLFDHWQSNDWIVSQKKGPFQAKDKGIPYTFLTLNKSKQP